MLDTGVTVLSGALTPSEVMAALRLGVHVVKLFPASLGGPGLPARPCAGRSRTSTFVPDRWGQRRQPRASGWPPARSRSERAASCARRPRMAGGDWDTITATARRVRRRRAPGEARRVTRGRDVLHGLRRGQHRRLVDPDRCSREWADALGLPTRTLVGHDVAAGLARREVYRDVVTAIRDDPRALGRAGHHAQDGRARRRPRPVRRLRRAGRDLRRDLLHRQARRPAGRQRQGPGDRPAGPGGVPRPRPLRRDRRRGAGARLRRRRHRAEPPARRPRRPAGADHLHRAGPGARSTTPAPCTSAPALPAGPGPLRGHAGRRRRRRRWSPRCRRAAWSSTPPGWARTGPARRLGRASASPSAGWSGSSTTAAPSTSCTRRWPSRRSAACTWRTAGATSCTAGPRPWPRCSTSPMPPATVDELGRIAAEHR